VINILILMSGSSQSFNDAGFAYPKNLVEISGQPLIQHVLDNLNPLKSIGGKNICIVRQDENAKHHVGAVIKLIDASAHIIEVQKETAGAACSALLAVGDINNDDPLIIINGDQIIVADLPAIIAGFQLRKLDGGIVVFEDIHPRWSFVKCDDSGWVIETAEKRPISHLATAGFYYFRHGRDYVQAAAAMLKKDAHVNGVFYVCPAYNEMILSRKNIGVHKIDRAQYHSLAAPSGVLEYEYVLKQRLAH
jgi:dTDP-glucose pyrophosphorylase